MKKILIIDDNEDILSIFKESLADEGYDVSIANSGKKGIELINKKQFDLLVTDINMPGISGIDILKKAKDHCLNIPIILMSANYLPVDPDAVRKLGVNAIISKTINDYDFCELINYCLENKVYDCKVF